MGFCFCWSPPNLPRLRYCNPQNIKLIRVSQAFPEKSAGAIHICPASIRTLNGPLWASVHVGVRFKAQVHHHGDGPGLLGSCYLKGGLLDPSVMRSLPNKAVDVIACKLSGDGLIFASSTHGSLDLVLSVFVYAACCTIPLEEA